MLATMIQRLLREHFGTLQLFVGIGFVAIAWFFFKPKLPESQFQLREADRKRNPLRELASPARHAKTKQETQPPGETRKVPPRLTGIRIDGKPHEILGIPAQSSKEEIQKAYRELMKRYHPDQIGRPGSREWSDAQKIAEAINLAKEEMLRRLKQP